MNPGRKLRVIYLPGIGDAGDWFQPRAVKTWKWWGVESELHSMSWADDRPWEDKFLRLLDRIDELSVKYKVALVGASAGAAAAINAYEARKDKIAGVVCICGKINRPQTIGDRYRTKNPSFFAAASQTAAALAGLDGGHRQRILCRYAIIDEVIPNKLDSQVPGGRNRLSPTLFHALTIGFQISFGAPGFLRFLKKQAANNV